MLKITPALAPCYSLAHQQRQTKLLGSLEVEQTDREAEPLRDLKLRMSANPPVFQPHEWHIEVLGKGAIQQLSDQQPSPDYDYLAGLDGEVTLELSFELTGAGAPVKESATTLLLPQDHWAGSERMPELLAAYVQPSAPFVEKIVKRASALLTAGDGQYSMDGYQSEDRRAPWMMAQAIWRAVAEQGLDYVSPPTGFATSGQRVRLPERIESSGAAACLDASILFAACLEQVGLSPVIALTKGHACVGCWLVPCIFRALSNEDPKDMRERIEAQDIVLFESTLALHRPVPSFSTACNVANELLAEEAELDFVLALDVKQARECDIRPLPNRREKEAPAAPAPNAAMPDREEPPWMPPVRKEDQEIAVSTKSDELVDTWQRRLLDLSKRNRMLNFVGRASHVKVFCPDIARLEDKLMQDGKSPKFDFISLEASDFPQLLESPAPLENEDFKDYVSKRLEDAKGKLVAAGESKQMEAALLNMYRKARNDLEEGGSNTLFMSIGMLRWREAPESPKSYKAPLILLPVKLHRRSARAPIKISSNPDEEPVFNATLIEFLQQDYEIDLSCYRETLPQDDHGVDVPQVWQRVREAIKETKGFGLVEDIVISNFSFDKFLMWKDLKERLPNLKESVFVNHLIEKGGGGGYPRAANFVNPQETDKRIHPGDLLMPMHADSSQLAAIDASTKKQDFVLEGPPGTGKSETISNIIAANIALGHKVLFVAEKMEALNVVYQRLSNHGLGNCCLELHSNKSNKKAVLAQLKAALKDEPVEPEDWEKGNQTLSDQRRDLNGYLEALHSSELCGISPWDAISKSAGAKDEELFDFQLPEDKIPIQAQEWLDVVLQLTAELLEIWKDVRDCDPKAVALVGTGEWSHQWERNFRDTAAKLDAHLISVTERLEEVAAALGVDALTTKDKAAGHLAVLADCLELSKEERKLLVFGKAAKRRREELEDIVQHVSEREQIYEKLGIDPDELTSKDTWVCATLAATSWLPIKSFHDKLRGWLSFSSSSTRGAGLRQIKKARKARAAVETQVKPFAKVGIWQGWENTSLDDLRKALLRGQRLRPAIRGLGAQLKIDVATVIESLEEEPGIRKAVASLRSTLAEMERDSKAWRELGVVLPEGLAEFAELLPKVRDIRRLDHCLDWNRARSAKCGDYVMQPIVDAIVSEQLRTDNYKQKLEKGFYHWIAPLLLDNEPELVGFRVRDHERLQREFVAQDCQQESLAGQKVAAVVAGRRQTAVDEMSKGIKRLRREITKKTRHIPIRKLLHELDEEILDITPCMMMSPVSIAQFLPRDFNHFDLVIFDEASQITVWDAVGPIARGKNVIVVGDPKQMPPTNFFNRTGSEVDDEEQDYESILDRALDAGLKKHRLTGHYRSKHESLIAFSNSKYYENSLATYPAASTSESEVHFHKVDNGLYSKGKEANNPNEAKAVAEEVLRRLLDSELSKRSIGVVALNQSQQRTIENFLDDKRRKHPEIEKFFSGEEGPPLFVKNLETVQGDERDVIMLSLGYGPTEPGAKSMSMNFGPLNRKGGERRLNVAITRAKYQVLVFASFDYTMIDLSRTQARAVADMRDYLEYAERGMAVLGSQAHARYGVDSFDSDFERDVAMTLREQGWKVQSQVGVSRFRIDLGVVHPNEPGRYLAAVECDGATYHGSPSARDRDRIRQSVLESLGWQFVRIWSTVYFRDPVGVMKDVDKRLRELLEQEKPPPT